MMRKLDADDVKFIDTYLENSDVGHVDIRFEMVDHVSTAIEAEMNSGDNRSFYYIFKDFMVVNKARLLNNNKQFLKQADKRISKLLLENLLSIKGLLLVALITLLVFLGFEKFGYIPFLKTISYSGLFLFLLGAITYGVILKVYKYERLSGVERLGFFLAVMFNIAHLIYVLSKGFFKDYFNEFTASFSIALAMTILILFFKVSYQITLEYSKRFKSLAKS